MFKLHFICIQDKNVYEKITKKINNKTILQVFAYLIYLYHNRKLGNYSWILTVTF